MIWTSDWPILIGSGNQGAQCGVSVKYKAMINKSNNEFKCWAVNLVFTTGEQERRSLPLPQPTTSVHKRSCNWEADLSLKVPLSKIKSMVTHLKHPPATRSALIPMGGTLPDKRTPHLL